VGMVHRRMTWRALASSPESVVLRYFDYQFGFLRCSWARCSVLAILASPAQVASKYIYPRGDRHLPQST
jgi:hypothetical protein